MITFHGLSEKKTIQWKTTITHSHTQDQSESSSDDHRHVTPSDPDQSPPKLDATLLVRTSYIYMTLDSTRHSHILHIVSSFLLSIGIILRRSLVHSHWYVSSLRIEATTVYISPSSSEWTLDLDIPVLSDIYLKSSTHVHTSWSGESPVFVCVCVCIFVYGLYVMCYIHCMNLFFSSWTITLQHYI